MRMFVTPYRSASCSISGVRVRTSDREWPGKNHPLSEAVDDVLAATRENVSVYNDGLLSESPDVSEGRGFESRRPLHRATVRASGCQEQRMNDRVMPDAADALSDDVTESGVFLAVLESYDAVYDALPRSETFNHLWRTNAYAGAFPDEFAHIGFLTVAEALRLQELLQIRPGDVLVDLACGTAGPGLWMTRESGASLIGVDPSDAGLATARERAGDVGLADRARFQQGTFEQTKLPDAAADTLMSIEAFQYTPNKRAAFAEFSRIMRPGARLGIVCFEVDPTKVIDLPVLGVDPIPDYRPLIDAAGLNVEAYDETPDWEERVYATFASIVANSDTLIAEMGERAAAGVLIEAMLTLQVKPYPRRIMAVASRPE
jgi:SAM-dependent methyltransferase